MAVEKKARDKLLNGQKTTSQWARKALPILVRQAKAGKTITYGDLAKEIKSITYQLGYTLGIIGSAIQELSEDWHGDKHKIPPINALVVNKNTKLSGRGIIHYVPDGYTVGTKAERTRKVEEMGLYDKIFSYEEWDSVLKELLQENK